jgi:plastocyanin
MEYETKIGMVRQVILIGIAVGVFFAGLGIGYGVLQATNTTNSMMMNDPQHMQKMMNDPQHVQKMIEMMQSNPQAMNSLMNSMMSDPQMWNQWMGNMMNNPQFMNRWMGQMMNDPNFQQQYMGNWMMMKDPQFRQNMMNQYSQQANLESSAVKTNIVSILADTWQYMATKAYSPSVIKVSADTTVTWKNEDQIIHTVTDLGGKFDSGFIQPAETWQYTFDSNGVYYYFCSIHPWMEGAVIVS